MKRLHKNVAAVLFVLAIAATSISGISGASALTPNGGMLISGAELAQLPTSGSAWSKLKSTADGSWGSVNLVDQDNKHPAKLLAGALVYARTGDDSYRARVVSDLRKLPGSDTGRVLALGRQLGSYVIAADLIGFREEAFVNWVDDIRNKDIGGHGSWHVLNETATISANNWGTFAAASRVAAAIYLNDQGDLNAAAEIFRRFVGDTGVNHEFNETGSFDSSWVCDDAGTWSPINPSSCGASKDGALVEDISRGPSHPNAADSGISYSLEALQGITLEALLLERAGFSDVWQWEDQAILRAGEFMDRQNAFPGDYSVDFHIPWILNAKYGSNFSTKPAGFGRLFGYTDWLYGTSQVAPSPTTTAPVTTTTTEPTTTIKPPPTTAPVTTSELPVVTTTEPSTTTTELPETTEPIETTVPIIKPLAEEEVTTTTVDDDDDDDDDDDNEVRRPPVIVAADETTTTTTTEVVDEVEEVIVDETTTTTAADEEVVEEEEAVEEEEVVDEESDGDTTTTTTTVAIAGDPDQDPPDTLPFGEDDGLLQDGQTAVFVALLLRLLVALLRMLQKTPA